MNQLSSSLISVISAAFTLLCYSSCKKAEKEYTPPQQERKLFDILCNGLWQDDSIVTKHSHDSITTFRFESYPNYLQYWEYLPSGTCYHVRVKTDVNPYKRHIAHRSSWLIGRDAATENFFINSYVRNLTYKDSVLIISDIEGYQSWYYHDIKLLVDGR